MFAACGQKGDGKSGEVKFQLVDIDGKTVIDTTFNHEDGKTLLDDLKEDFKVDEASGFVNGIFLKDESAGILANYADGSWLCLYVDGEMSMVGIADVAYHDGITLKWVETPA